MGYSINSLTDNCYPNTTILINKLDLHDQKLLDEAEQMITAINYAKAEKEIKFDNVNFEFYKLIHLQLFSDIYEWAGSIRNVDIFKKGTAFCKHNEIEYMAKMIFERLKQNDYLKNIDYADFLRNNVNAGTASVIVNSGDNFYGSATKTFKIQPADLSKYDVTLSQDSFSYDGSEKKPGVTVRSGNTQLVYSLRAVKSLFSPIH